MIFKRFGFSLGIIVFLLLGCLIADTVGAQDKTNLESEQRINDFSLAGYGEKGKKSWEINGKTADIFTDVVVLQNIEGNLYGKDQDIKLTADKGNFNKAESTVHLQDNVVITTSEGTKMTTESLDWDRKNQLVSTKERVNIERDNMLTVAEGATGEPGLKKVTLEKDVQVDIDTAAQEGKGVMGKDKIVITCDGPLEVDYEKSMATFKNNVKVHTSNADIYSDTMDIYFLAAGTQNAPPEKTDTITAGMGSKIDKIVATGHVKIVRGENVSYSESATYSASDNKMILSGRPQLIIYSEKGGFDASFGN